MKRDRITAWRPSRHLIAIGPTGCGKTFAVERWASLPARVVYIAPCLDPDSWPERHGRRVIRENEQDEGLALFAHACAEGKRAHLIVEGRAGDAYVDDVCAWADLVMECGNATLVVDEIEEVLDPRAPDELKRIWLRGRKAEAWLIGVGHRPLSVPRVATSSCDMVAWRTTEPLDLAYYKKAGIPEGPLRALPPYHGIVKTLEGKLYLLTPGGAVTKLPAPAADSA